MLWAGYPYDLWDAYACIARATALPCPGPCLPQEGCGSASASARGRSAHCASGGAGRGREIRIPSRSRTKRCMNNAPANPHDARYAPADQTTHEYAPRSKRHMNTPPRTERRTYMLSSKRDHRRIQKRKKDVQRVTARTHARMLSNHTRARSSPSGHHPPTTQLIIHPQLIDIIHPQRGVGQDVHRRWPRPIDPELSVVCG